jgi:plastocyanin
MKKLLFSLILFTTGLSGFCTTWTITNSGFTFSPASLTINSGDNVNFTIASIHTVVEVSQATWNANGNTPLPAGFQLPLGGGLVQASLLGVGTHYYVCSPHASLGMKGIIIVQSVTAIDGNGSQKDLMVYPNPTASQLTIVASGELIGLKYSITDQKGRQVMNGKLPDESSQIDLGQLTPGIYIIRVSGPKRYWVKVIKY